MTPPPETDPRTRRLVYGLLITLAAGLTAGRIASAERLHEPSVHKTAGSPVPRPAWPATRPDPWPTFSSNDRSRWAAARALVEEGTFVVGRRDKEVVVASGPAMLAAQNPLQAVVLLQAGFQARVRSDKGIIFEEGFQSVDKVLHPETMEFYSTKPPLLTLMMAGEYWVLNRLFGLTIVEHRFEVVRLALVTFNLIPLVLYLIVLAWLAERFGTTDWSRYFIVAAGAFATLVSPFLVTINNHTLAATGAAVVLYAVVRIREDGASWWLFLLGGFAAGFTACLELPALALAAGVFVYLAWHHPYKVPLFLIAALVPALISVGANYVQLGQLKPAYAQFGGPWYEYEGSHWVPPGVYKRGIDFARRNGETRATYAFHLLIGHHGIFSLTPVMLLAVAGMAMGMGRWLKAIIRDRNKLLARVLLGEDEPEEWNPSRLMNSLLAFTLFISLVVIGFYLFKSDNYGGWSNGPRWLMWLSPLWLVAMLPVLDVLAKWRWGRLFALVLLALSILSMSYQNWNPWRHPWLYNWMEARGWVNY
jgi:hypothetical protein